MDVLPIYLEGTYDALPKGRLFPKSKKLGVRIGPALGVDELRARVSGMARSEGYRYATRVAEDAVRALRDGKTLTLRGRARAAVLAASGAAPTGTGSES